MKNIEQKTKPIGFDIMVSAAYFAALFISLLITGSTFNSGNHKAAYVSCFVLTIPCILDGFKEFVCSISLKKTLDILNLVISGLLTIIALTLLSIICVGWNNEILGKVLIYGSILSFGKYLINIGNGVAELIRIKFPKGSK